MTLPDDVQAKVDAARRRVKATADDWAAAREAQKQLLMDLVPVGETCPLGVAKAVGLTGREAATIIHDRDIKVGRARTLPTSELPGGVVPSDAEERRRQRYDRS